MGTHADWRLESSVTSAGQSKILVATSHGGGGGRILFSRKRAHGGGRQNPARKWVLSSMKDNQGRSGQCIEGQDVPELAVKPYKHDVAWESGVRGSGASWPCAACTWEHERA